MSLCEVEQAGEVLDLFEVCSLDGHIWCIINVLQRGSTFHRVLCIVEVTRMGVSQMQAGWSGVHPKRWIAVCSALLVLTTAARPEGLGRGRRAGGGIGDSVALPLAQSTVVKFDDSGVDASAGHHGDGILAPVRSPPSPPAPPPKNSTVAPLVLLTSLDDAVDVTATDRALAAEGVHAGTSAGRAHLAAQRLCDPLHRHLSQRYVRI